MTTENKEAVFSRPGDISNYKNHILSLRKDKHNQYIPVFSP